MKNASVYFKIGVLGVVVAGVLGLIFFRVFGLERRNDPNASEVEVYFRNGETLEWGSETRRVRNGTDAEVCAAAINELRAGPKGQKFKKAVPEYIEPLEVTLARDKADGRDYRLAIVDFGESYYAMTAGEAADCLSGLVWTLTGLRFIDAVRVNVAGEPLLLSDGSVAADFSRKNVKLDLWLADATTSETITLYFPNKDGTGLISETRDVERQAGDPVETSVVAELISGPRTIGLVRVLPKETKVLSTKRDDVTCYVDLSSDFLSRLGAGTVEARLALYSIVNALTERQGIKKVQILIEGERAESEAWSELATAFERDDNMILR